MLADVDAVLTSSPFVLTSECVVFRVLMELIELMDEEFLLVDIVRFRIKLLALELALEWALALPLGDANVVDSSSSI